MAKYKSAARRDRAGGHFVTKTEQTKKKGSQWPPVFSGKNGLPKGVARTYKCLSSKHYSRTRTARQHRKGISKLDK
jgi:hypothetical protein